MGEHNVNVWINPLIFFGSEFRPNGIVVEETSYNTMMGFLCRPGIGSQVADLVTRYNEISVEKNRLALAPNEDRLMNRLIWPLRDAKASYVTGNFLGAIALCGLVAEMAAILMFDLHNEAGASPVYDEHQQKQAFGGYTFEELGQSRRVKELKRLGLIGENTRTAFETVRKARNRYLHLWSEGHEQVNEEAITCFDAALEIVIAALGLEIRQGKLFMRDELFTYLNRHGVATPWNPPSHLLVPDQGDETDPTDPTDLVS